jgi:hypothetical protein
MKRWLNELGAALGIDTKPRNNIDKATQMRLKLLKKEGERILY